MKEKIYQSALMMGLPSEVDMNVVFARMGLEMLAVMESQLDKDSTDYQNNEVHKSVQIRTKIRGNLMSFADLQEAIFLVH